MIAILRLRPVHIWTFAVRLLVAVVVGGWVLPPGPSPDMFTLTHARPALAAPVGARPAPDNQSVPQVPPLTLADIFPPRDLSAFGLDPTRLRTIIATGDVIPARSVDTVIREQGNDFFYPLAATAHILPDADLTVINLEAPLLHACPPHNYGPVFCGQAPFAQALRAVGVDIATLENNHIDDYGLAGIDETKQGLEAAGLAWVDRHTPAVIDVRGLKFGFLAFNGIGPRFDRALILTQINALRPQVDVLVVAMHWGAEYVALPQRSWGIACDDPTEMGRLVIDAGANLVIGNHPHWVQAVELYHDRLITYAHGNFIFDQMWSDQTRLGVMGYYTFYDNILIGAEFIPTRIDNGAQPVPLQGAAAQTVQRQMGSASLQHARRVTP